MEYFVLKAVFVQVKIHAPP